jgi:HD-like signal output (HDOD) protein
MAQVEEAPKEFEGRLKQGRDWREIVAWVGDLPPMPHVASKAIQLVEDPNVTAPELTELLSSDTALAARVLKIANSAMFSRQREITTLNQAIMIIGFKALKGIIVAATLRQANKNFGKLEQLVWENSMCSAMFATNISKKLKKRFVDEIFLLGLLHSLGQIVLMFNKETAVDYKRVIALIETSSKDFVAAEDEVLGFCHPLIGALVAKKWNFSAETCQVILHYRDAIEAKPESDQDQKTTIVQLAELMSHEAGIGSPPNYPKRRDEIERLAVLVGFDPKVVKSAIDELLADTLKTFEAEKNIYD